MIKGGKEACDYCGKRFKRATPRFRYTDGTSYHTTCAKKVGGPEDGGRR